MDIISAYLNSTCRFITPAAMHTVCKSSPLIRSHKLSKFRIILATPGGGFGTPTAMTGCLPNQNLFMMQRQIAGRREPYLYYIHRQAELCTYCYCSFKRKLLVFGEKAEKTMHFFSWPDSIMVRRENYNFKVKESHMNP